MRLGRFAYQLLITSFLAVAVFMLFKGYAAYPGDVPFFGWSLLFFILFSVFLYVLGLRLSTSRHINAFSYLVILSILIKLVCSIAIVLYFKNVYGLNQPIKVIPFLTTYICFTAFEVYFLSTLAQRSIFK